MREFNSLVFMGAGEKSMADSYRLHKMLDKALSNLSALQQGLRGFNSIKADELEIEIENTAKDICIALLGRKIAIGKRVDKYQVSNLIVSKAEEVKRSLEENHRKVESWSESKKAEAAATVNSPRVSSYYEPPVSGDIKLPKLEELTELQDITPSMRCSR